MNSLRSLSLFIILIAVILVLSSIAMIDGAMDALADGVVVEASLIEGSRNVFNGRSMMERLEKQIELGDNGIHEVKPIDVSNEESPHLSNDVDHSSSGSSSSSMNGAKEEIVGPSSVSPSKSKELTEKANEDANGGENRELGVGRAIANTVWFLVIITVIPCLLCTCLLSCLCYTMEWIPSPFSGEYYSSGPYGGGGIWGGGSQRGTGWFGSGSTA